MTSTLQSLLQDKDGEILSLRSQLAKLSHEQSHTLTVSTALHS